MSVVFGSIDPKWTSWVEVESDTDFPIQNLPFGVYKKADSSIRIGLAIGNKIVDLFELCRLGYLSDISTDTGLFSQTYINEIMARGKKFSNGIRLRVAELLKEGNEELQKNKEHVNSILIDQVSVTMQIPVYVRDYTDFYSSLDHAKNVGTMFRGAENAIMPNWKYLPVGYHGRASSIVVSGTDIHRPYGQAVEGDSTTPVFAPSRLMDFELEMAFVTCKPTKLGERISVEDAEDHIFGLMLFNDLSARDIQKWEYVPLGPFLGKNFGSIVSPWVVVLEALDLFRVEGYKLDPPALPYLESKGKRNYDIDLTVEIETPEGKSQTLCHSNFKFMYWNMCQQLAHQTINGCNIGVGDMYASGTISGPDPSQFGSMLEITWRGSKPVKMSDGTERKFIQDNDSIIIKGWGKKEGVRIGFGECRTKILPAKN